MRIVQSSSTFLALMLLASPAFAGPGKITSPYVTKGKLELESKGADTFDYGGPPSARWDNRLDAEYGVTDFMNLEAEGRVTSSPGQGGEYSSTAFGAKFQIAPKGRLPIDLGVKLSYIVADDKGAADQVEIKGLAAKDLGAWKLAGNYRAAREVGDFRKKQWNSSLALGAYRSFGKFYAGPEYFGDFGEFRAGQSYSEQAHYVGPLVGYKTQIPGAKGTVDMKLGYYAGVSRAAQDAGFRYQLDLDF